MGDQSDRKRKMRSLSSSSDSGNERKADARDETKLNAKVSKKDEYDTKNAGPSTSRQPGAPVLSSQTMSLLETHSATYSKPSPTSNAQRVGTLFGGVLQSTTFCNASIGPSRQFGSGRELMSVFNEAYEQFYESMSKWARNQQASPGVTAAAASGSGTGTVAEVAPRKNKSFTPLGNALRNRPTQLSSSDDSDYEPRSRQRRYGKTAATQGEEETMPRTNRKAPAKVTEHAVDSSNSSSGESEER